MASIYPYKQCPTCGATNQLQAPVCPTCGHQFSTQFNQQGQTQAFYTPPPQPPYSQQPSNSYQPGPQYQQGNQYSQFGYGQQSQYPYAASDKSKVAAAMLAFFLGVWGVHRFYLGYNQTGIWMLVLTIVGILTSCIYVGIFLILAVHIWAIIDFVQILTGQLGDSNGQPLSS